MEKSNHRTEKSFIGLGILATISGILLAFEQPIIGISGAIVGIWLIIDNIKKLKHLLCI